MKRISQAAITLIELLISIALLAMVVIGFMSIEMFGRNHLIGSDRRAKLQNEAALVLEHMTKQLAGAICDPNASPVTITAGSANNVTKAVAYIDDLDGIANNGDNRATYCFQSTDCGTSGAANVLSFEFYNNTSKSTEQSEVLSARVSFFNITSSVTDKNYIRVLLRTCWDPDGSPFACNTSSNPSITLNTTIRLPSVSTN